MIADGLGLLDRVHVKACLHQKKHVSSHMSPNVRHGMAKTCFMASLRTLLVGGRTELQESKVCCCHLTRPKTELAWTRGKVIAMSSPAQGRCSAQEATELAEESLLKLAVDRKSGTKCFLRLTSCYVAKCCPQDPLSTADHLQQRLSTGRVPFSNFKPPNAVSL